MENTKQVANVEPVSPAALNPAPSNISAKAQAKANEAKVKAKGATSKAKASADTSKGVAKATSPAAPVFAVSDMVPMSNADADKAIRLIRSTGNSLRKTAHKAACGIVMHYVKHGDYTKLNDLRSAVSDAMSKAMARGLDAWVSTFCPSLRYDTQGKTYKHSSGERKFNLTGDPQAQENTHERNGALNNPFYSGSFGDKEPETFVFTDWLAKAVKTVRQKLERQAEQKTRRDKARYKVDEGNVKALEAFAKAQGVDLSKLDAKGNA